MASPQKKPKNWRTNGSKRSSFSAGKLAVELHDLLEIPMDVYHSKGGFRYEEPATGRRIIVSIVKVMVDALQREESIRIPGFGVFAVKDKPARRSGHSFVAVDKDGTILATSPVPITTGPKKVVVFYPSAHLEALVNIKEPNVPNWAQRKAIRNWSK